MVTQIKLSDYHLVYLHWDIFKLIDIKDLPMFDVNKSFYSATEYSKIVCSHII